MRPHLRSVRSRAFLSALAAGWIMIGATAPEAAAQAALPVNVGELVHTFQAPNNLGNVVVTLVDTTPAGLSGAVLGSNYLAPLFWNAAPAGQPTTDEWTSDNLGQVFGVTLDGAPNPNIYVIAANKQFIYPGQTTAAAAYGPLGPGGVYRLDGTTGAIGHLVTLTNDPATFVGSAGLGNITYYQGSNSLYVSNFADGLIYRIPLGPSVAAPWFPLPPLTAIPTYDHGLDGRANWPPLLTIQDDGAPGPTQVGRRVWGLAVHGGERRLYYGVWWENFTAPLIFENNEVWSVELDNAGDPKPITARLEFMVPALALGCSSPVASLNITPSGTLLIGERSIGLGGQNAHKSRLLEYRGASGLWVAEPLNKYLLDGSNFPPLTGTSCAGGTEMDCDGNVWSTADGLQFAPGNYVYGLIRIPVGGNTNHTPPTQSCILIDSDRGLIIDDKTEIGTLALREGICCPPSGSVVTFPLPNGAADQRCGDLPASAAHYSIDSIGLVNNPGGFVSVGSSNVSGTGLPGLHAVRWTKDGNILRQRLFSTNVANELIVATSVDVDPDCYVLVAGRTQVGSSFGTFVTLLDPLLYPVWMVRVPGNMSGGENVQADWLNDHTIIVSGMAGTGAAPAFGRLTRLTDKGALLWSKQYPSPLGGTNPRLIIDDVEQAPGAMGNIWACGGITQDGPTTTTVVPMLMEVVLGPATGGPPGGTSGPSGITIYKFPAGSTWTSGRFNALKLNPTPGANNNDFIVAGSSSKTTGGPFPTTTTAARVAMIHRPLTAVQLAAAVWDNLYPGAVMIPGTSAISVGPQSPPAPPNQIVVAGRTVGSSINALIHGVTLRVSEPPPGLFVSAQRHGTPSIPNVTYGFADITPGSYRVMVGTHANIAIGGGSQFWFSPGNCPTPFTSAAESVAITSPETAPVAATDVTISPLVLVEQPIVTPCTIICRPCYANCDASIIPPILNVNDFLCFMTKYAAADESANCDGSTEPPVLTVNDFVCFMNAYAASCP